MMRRRTKWTAACMAIPLCIPTVAANAATGESEIVDVAFSQRFDDAADVESPTGARNRTPVFDLRVTAGGESENPWTDENRIDQNELPRISRPDSIIVGENISLVVLKASEAEQDPAELGLLAAAIRCDLNVQNVHGSTHVAGTINGIASINCTGAAGSLQIHYSMIRLSPYAQWAGPSRTNGGYSSITTNRATSCTEGRANFRGWAQGIIAPPPGYSLTGPAILNAYGNISYVECRGHTGPYSSTAPAIEGSGQISVTFVRNDLLEAGIMPSGK